MTSYDVIRALLRRWWFLGTGLALTLIVVAAIFTRSTPIYWTTYDLNLVAPDRSGEVYSRVNAPSGVTPVAGVLEVLLAGNDTGPSAATQQVPIFALSHQFGVDVRAKDKGLQWSRDYVAALVVQIAQPSRAEVEAQVDVLGRRAAEALSEIQDQQSVPAEARLTLEEPGVVQIIEIAPSRIRAVAGALLLGLGVSLVLTVLLDRRLIARRRRPRTVMPG